MAIIDKDFNKWIESFRGLNPDLFTGKRGLSERMADSIAQIAFAAGKAAARSQATTAAGLVDGFRSLVAQWRHNAQGCGRNDSHAAGTWRSCARELEAAIGREVTKS